MIAEPDEHDVCGRCGFTYGHHVGVWPEAGCEKIGGPQFATGIRHELLGDVPLEQMRALIRSELAAALSGQVRPGAYQQTAADPPAVEHKEWCRIYHASPCNCGAPDREATKPSERIKAYWDFVRKEVWIPRAPLESPGPQDKPIELVDASALTEALGVLGDALAWTDRHNARPHDFACRECTPDAPDNVFRCWYHAGKALLARHGVKS